MSETNLATFGVDINNPDQSVLIYFDHKRAASWLDQKMLLALLVAVPTLLMVQSTFALNDDPFDPFNRLVGFIGLTSLMQMTGVLLVIGFVLMCVAYVKFRSAFSKMGDEPMLKIEKDGITISFEPLRFNLMPWEELGEVAVKTISTPDPVLRRIKISGGTYLGISPINPNTLYKLAVDEKTKTMLGRRAAVNKWPNMQRYQEIPLISIGECYLPSPLTRADLALLINTRRALALCPKKEISQVESSVQELAPIEEKFSVIEIKHIEKQWLKLK